MTLRKAATAPEYTCDHCGQEITHALRFVVRIEGGPVKRGTEKGPGTYTLATYDLHDVCEKPFVKRITSQAPSVPDGYERWPEEDEAASGAHP